MQNSPYGGFADRLHEALDAAGFAKGRARTGALAIRYAVSRETARKWLTGQSLPELERMITMAVDFGAPFEWLATGRAAQNSQLVSEPVAAYLPKETERLHSLIARLTDRQRRGLLDSLSE